MGRFEAFALGNGPWRAFLDGIGNAVGYGVILIAVGFFRELLGSGTLLGFKVLGDPIEKTGLYAIGYENNGFMLLSPMALIVVGILIWIQRSRNTSLIEESFFDFCKVFNLLCERKFSEAQLQLHSE